MNKRTLSLIIVSLGLWGLTTSGRAQPNPITGQIKFGSTAPVSLTGGTRSFLTATGLDFSPLGSAVPGINAIVNLGASGSFTGLDLTFASFKDFTFDPLPPGGADVWELSGGLFSFHLESVSVKRTARSIILTGVGVISGPGWDPVPATFYFSTQTTAIGKTKFSFSANSAALAVIAEEED